MNDRSQAVALEIAERMLIKGGWSWDSSDLGRLAADILLEMEEQKRKGIRALDEIYGKKSDQ